MSQAQRLSIIAGVVLAGIMFYLIKPVITPFLLAALLAYLGDPLVKHLMRWKLPRMLAATVVFLIIVGIIFLILFLLIPMLVRQVALFIEQLPAMLAWLQDIVLPWVNQYFQLDISFDLQTLKDMLSQHWQQAGNLALEIGRILSSSGMAIVGWCATVLLVPVVMFYLLRDWEVVINELRELLPRRFEAPVVNVISECNEVLSAFFRGQLWVILGMAVYYSIGLSIVGLNLALLLGVVAGILTLVPYLGVTVGIIAAAIAALLQFHDWLSVLYVGIVFMIGQVLESMVLTPWLVGDRIGLHPVAVIFAVLVGGHLFGFFGVLLALPVAAVVMVLLRHLKQQYVHSEIYQ